MSDGDFEEKIRAIFKEVSQSIEQAAESIDLDEIADRLGVSSERFRDFAETAGQWLSDQFVEHDEPAPEHEPDVRAPEHGKHEHEHGKPEHEHGKHEHAKHEHERAKHQHDEPRPRARRGGPHPRDLPTEEQGLALSALDSGRWTIKPGTYELVSGGEGPDPQDTAGLVGELRARDWIGASGELTLVGRDALRRWLESTASAQ